MKVITRITTAIVAMVTAAMPALAQSDLPPKAVKLMQVANGEAVLSRQFYGQVTAKETVDLAFQVGGQILEFDVAEGAIIPEGSLIAALDLEPFELSLAQAKLQKDSADRALTRLQKLSSNVSQVAVDDAQTAVGLAAVALRNSEYALEHASLYAPFDALVSSRQVAPFTTVAAGTPVARLHDMSELHIQVDVPEVLFQQASRTEILDISAKFPGSDTAYPLAIHEFNAEASTVGQSYSVTFKLNPPKDRTIYPGASVTVNVSADAGQRQIVLPPTAIVADTSGQPGVMLFSPAGAAEGTVRWTEVSIVPTPNGSFAATSGLSAGDEVVLTGGAALSEGQQVRRFTGFSN
jgi:RND family efflux transporter MFP subunit